MLSVLKNRTLIIAFAIALLIAALVIINIFKQDGKEPLKGVYVLEEYRLNSLQSVTVKT